MSFSVISWNCLADCYAFNQKEVKDKSLLEWDKRSPRLSKYISEKLLFPSEQNEASASQTNGNGSRNNILCLQEVDHFTDFWEPTLTSAGFDVVYAQRGGNKSDGVLIAYQRARFALVKQHIVDFDDLATEDTRLQGVRFRKHNIGLICVLRDLECDKMLIVVTVHLYWNPHYADVKLQQALYLLKHVEYILADNPEQCVVLCGDFNDLPEGSVYQFVSTQVHDSSSLEFNRNRIVLDRNLQKEARWLRAIGIDCAVWPVVDDFEGLFAMAIKEKRILVSANRRLLLRKNAPPFAYVSSNVRKDGSLFQQLVQLFQYKFRDDIFYSRCTLCNGDFAKKTWTDIQLLGIFEPELPDNANTDGDYYLCLSCSQVYWWGIRSENEEAKYRTRFNDAYAALDSKTQVQEDEGDMAKVTDEMKKQPSKQLTNVYANKIVHNLSLADAYADSKYETLPTNVVHNFVGRLDYVFFSHNKLVCLEVLEPRTSYEPDQIFPSITCPSDHVPVGARFQYK